MKLDNAGEYELGRSMDKSAIIAKLREHEGELKAAGIEHLFLHGSYARGTAIRGMSQCDVGVDRVHPAILQFIRAQLLK